MEELKLYLKMRNGEYCAARVGVMLVIYYAKSIQELADVVPEMYRLYTSFIPDGVLKSLAGVKGSWIKTTKRALMSRFNQLQKEGTYMAEPA